MTVDEFKKENKILLTYSLTAFQLLAINFYLVFIDIKKKSITQRKDFKTENKGSRGKKMKSIMLVNNYQQINLYNKILS